MGKRDEVHHRDAEDAEAEQREVEQREAEQREAEMGRQLKTGEGWRLGWDAESIEFCGLVGTEDWAIELTAAEFDDFCRLVVQLAETMAQMAQELMDEERISCEVESDRIWLEAEGLPQDYELRLMVLTGRRVEGTWQGRSILGLVQAIQTLAVF